MAGVVHVPWYATVFRGDKLAAALEDIAPVALRFGATSYSVFRYRDDRYKFIQTAEFQNHTDWERYWYGQEFVDWRVANSSYYQVPVIYGWTDLLVSGTLEPDLSHSATGGAARGDLAG